MQFINCTTRRLLFHEPYESYGSWTCIYTPSPLVICSPQTVRLVSHCLTTRTSRTGRGLAYTPQVSLMICTPTTVRLVDHCFTTRTSRTNRTGRAKRNMPLYGSYQFVYIGQPSTSPIVINVPTKGLLAVETKNSFLLWLANSNINRIVYQQ